MEHIDEISLRSSTQTVGFRDVIRALMRGAPIAIGIALMSGLIALVNSSRQPAQYRASVSLVAAQPYGSYGSLELVRPPQVAPRVYQAALLDGAILHDAAEAVMGHPLSGEEMVALRKRVRTSVENQGTISGIVRVEVTHEDARLAAAFANAISQELTEWDRGRSRQVVSSSIAALEDNIAQLDREISAATEADDSPEVQLRQVQLATLRLQRAQELESARARGALAVPVGAIEILSPAVVPEIPVGPRVLFNTFVALVVGAILGYLAQFLAWALRAEVGNRGVLERVTGLPVLSEFPKSARFTRRFVGDAGSYLRVNVTKAAPDAAPLVIGVTSPTSYKEKQHIAEVLAQKFSASGQRTLLIDGDLQKQGPGIGKAAARSQVVGFDAYLSEVDRPLRPLVVEVNSSGSFHFIPSNRPLTESSELIIFGLQRFVRGLANRYDVVIVDLPPITAQADAVAASDSCTGLIVCVRPTTDRNSLHEALQALRLASAKVFGTVLVGSPRTTLLQSRSRLAASRPRPEDAEASQVGKGVAQAVARVKTRA